MGREAGKNTGCWIWLQLQFQLLLFGRMILGAHFHL